MTREGEGKAAILSCEKLLAKVGYGKGLAGKFDPIGQGHDLVSACPKSIPVKEVDKTVICVSTDPLGIRPRGPVGYSLYEGVIDLHLDGIGITGPAGNHTDTAHDCTKRWIFQYC